MYNADANPSPKPERKQGDSSPPKPQPLPPTPLPPGPVPDNNHVSNAIFTASKGNVYNSRLVLES